MRKHTHYKIYLFTVFIIFSYLISFAQSPSLIFHSGFEPNTQVVSQSSGWADIIGIDNSVSAPNNWVNGLETHPNIGGFAIQYQGGDSTMRFAKIVNDPVNASNKALWFWVNQPNVSGIKGRVQANLFGSPVGFANLYYSIRLFLPNDLNVIKSAAMQSNWFTLMEFWNNNGWTGNLFPFRVAVNLQKKGVSPDSLIFAVHGQTIDSASNYFDVWESNNKCFSVPTGKWMTIEINYIEGNNSTGRFYMAVTPDGDTKTVVFDLKEYTYHPSDPSPDGLKDVNPFMIYTSKALIDTINSHGKLANVYWDDFKLWKDSTAGSTPNKVTLTSAAGTNYQTVCQNTVITNITYTTSIGVSSVNVTGLPTGINWNWIGSVITISGASSQVGFYPFTINMVQASGGCAAIKTTGAITLKPTNGVTLTSGVGSDNQTIAANTALMNITYSAYAATGTTVTGLPPGVAGTWSANVLTISGTPTVSGTFSYTVIFTGCGTITKKGTVNVTAVGIKNYSLNNQPILVYPNPFTSSFQINIEVWAEKTISIYNTMGELIFIKTSNDKITEVDLGNHASGIYFFKIDTYNESFTTKIIKQ